MTAAKLPEGHDWKTFNGAIKAHGVVLAGGQGKLAGKIFRLGHLGSVTVEEILGVIAVLEIRRASSRAGGSRRERRSARPTPRPPTRSASSSRTPASGAGVPA